MECTWHPAHLWVVALQQHGACVVALACLLARSKGAAGCWRGRYTGGAGCAAGKKTMILCGDNCGRTAAQCARRLQERLADISGGKWQTLLTTCMEGWTKQSSHHMNNCFQFDRVVAESLSAAPQMADEARQQCRRQRGAPTAICTACSPADWEFLWGFPSNQRLVSVEVDRHDSSRSDRTE